MRHPPRRDCDCDFCFADDLNAVLRRFLEQREKRRQNPDDAIREAFRALPDKFKRDPAEIAAIRDAARQARDPDAEQLAADVAGVCDEMARVG